MNISPALMALLLCVASSHQSSAWQADAHGPKARIVEQRADHIRSEEGSLKVDDGVELYYRDVGSGQSVVVVPIAAWLSPHFDQLASNRRVIYYDPRGRGRSGTGDLGLVSLNRAVQDLEALRSHFKIERMALIGWSGYGLEMAAYAVAHPTRVTRLVQLNPVPPRQEPYMSARNTAMRERVDGAGWGTYLEMTKQGAAQDALCRQYNRALAPALFVNPQRAHASIDRLCESANEWPERQQAFFKAFLPSVAALDMRAQLGELKMPRLILHGDRDLIAVEGVREWLAGPGDARILIVPDADHGSFLDAPRVVIPAIDRFLGGRWPEGAL